MRDIVEHIYWGQAHKEVYASMEWVEIHMKNTIMLWDIGLDESSGMMDIVATIGYKRVQDYAKLFLGNR